MSTLIVDRKNLELRTEGATLALYDHGERRQTVPLALIERVVIRAPTTLSSGVVSALAEAGVGLVVLSPRREQAALLLGRPHADARVRLAQYRTVVDPTARLSAARRIVRAKLLAQRSLLARASIERPDRRKPLHDAAAAVETALARLEAAADLSALLGQEGAASAAYFAAYTALFPESLGFTHRNRRPPRDPVNASLSLGYTLLHAEAVRRAHAAGLDPQLGFLHAPSRGRASLACDLVEPLRARIDAWVWQQFRTRALRAEDFTVDQGACLLAKPARGRFYASYEAIAQPLYRCLARHCRLIARRLLASAPVFPDADEEAAQ